MKSVSLLLLLLCSFSNGFQIGGSPPSKLSGSVCAYGDIDRDLLTDLILHDGDRLVIHKQTEEGGFEELTSVSGVDGKFMSCAVGDFDGDSAPDILVMTKRHADGKKEKFEYSAKVYKQMDSKHFSSVHVDGIFADELAVVDVDGDGTSDLIGFLSSDNKFYCRRGTKDLPNFLPCEKLFSGQPPKFLKGFPISFVDLNGDLSAELIFGENWNNSGNNVLALDVWSRSDSDSNWVRTNMIKELVLDLGKYYASPLFADFDADGVMDIAVPICVDQYCRKVESIRMWLGHSWVLVPAYGLVDTEVISPKEPVSVAFRVGDFTLDGYPDLVALIREQNRLNPMILENNECGGCTSNATREFVLRNSPRLIQPSEVSLGVIQMVSFFDLKEDGNLDVLLEYVSAENKISIDFIRYADGGDTTFLKVEVFTSTCTNNCGSDKIKIGSGIAWHGTCVSYNMTVSRKLEQRGVQCQLPQTTHRTFYSPFTLFGLGRSPNFVDYVRVGSPRLPPARRPGLLESDNQRLILKQIVPNSRVIVVPPLTGTSDTHWQSRLYVTPSALIIQSLLVLVSVCSILLLIIAVLHIRERRIDKQERQAQSHRFHFDAM